MRKNSVLVKANREKFRTKSSFKDLTGIKFDFLLVIKIFGYKKYKNGSMKWFWECLCDCGNIRYCSTSELEEKITYSCGCKKYYKNTPNKIYDIIDAAYRAKVSNYKAAAKVRKIKWELSMEEAIILLKGNCFYCGSEPSNTYSLLRNRKNKHLILSASTIEKHKLVYYSGIDRIANEKGYVRGNSVSCCRICNTAKMQMSLVEFYTWIDKVVAQRTKNEISTN